MDYKDMSLDELKELAKECGLKKQGVGWPTCCPPDGNRADIIKALKKFDSAAPSTQIEKMSLDELKELAKECGLKKQGVGWPTCCPPDGNRADIIKALKKKGEGPIPHFPDLGIGSLHFRPSRTISDLHFGRREILAFIEEGGLDEDVVMNMYTGDIYKALNKSLDCGSLSQSQKKFSLLLGDAIYKIKEKLPKTVYRGLNLKMDELKEYKQAEGRRIYWYGFTSTSRIEAVAQGFGPVLVEIELEKGNRDCVADMTRVSKYPNEREVLISANAGFVVESVDVQRRRIKLVLDDNEHCPMWERD
jgi:hypothetical protein